MTLTAFAGIAVATGPTVPPSPSVPPEPPRTPEPITAQAVSTARSTIEAADLRNPDTIARVGGIRFTRAGEQAALRDQAFFGLPVTPTAHVPMLKGSPATVEVAGQVPTPEMKASVLRVVRAEAARIRPDVVIEDRMAVVPTMAHAA